LTLWQCAAKVISAFLIFAVLVLRKAVSFRGRQYQLRRTKDVHPGQV